MISITLDSLIIANTPPTTKYIVPDTGIQGLEWADLRVSSFDIPEQDGEFISKNFYGGRVIGIPIRILGETDADYIQNRQDLIDVLRPKSSNGRATLRMAEFVLDDGSVRNVEYIGGELRLPYRHSKYADGSILIRCPDPALKGSEVTSETILSEGGGFDIDSMPKNNGGLVFNGSSALVNMGDVEATEDIDEISFVFWFLTTNNTVNQELVTKGRYFNAASSWGSEYDGTSGRFQFSVSNSRYIWVAHRPNNNVWTHVAMVYSKTTSTTAIYINGALVAPGVNTGTFITIPNTTKEMKVGIGDRGVWLVGRMDQLRIFDKLLSVDEIIALRTGDVVPSGLIGEWLFDEGSGVSAVDTSTNTNNGVITNATYFKRYEAIQFFTGGFSTTFDISASVGGSVVINNAGNLPSYPVITIRGAVDNPTVTNQTTGQFMSLASLNLEAGESVTIDMKNRTIRVGTQNLFSTKTVNSTFWTLASGNNTILFTDTGYSATAQMTIRYRSAWGGA